MHVTSCDKESCYWQLFLRRIVSNLTFLHIIYLRQRRYMFSPARPRSFVCLSFCVQDYSKMRAWIWMKCCASTDVGTWTNWLTFDPDPDYSPDVRTGLLSPKPYALQRGISLRRENLTYWYWAPVEAATRGFEASKHRCRRKMRSTEWTSSYNCNGTADGWFCFSIFCRMWCVMTTYIYGVGLLYIDS